MPAKPKNQVLRALINLSKRPYLQNDISVTSRYIAINAFINMEALIA